MIDQLRLVDRSFGFLPLPLTAFFSPLADIGLPQ
jgi:hypothetical protein